MRRSQGRSKLAALNDLEAARSTLSDAERSCGRDTCRCAARQGSLLIRAEEGRPELAVRGQRTEREVVGDRAGVSLDAVCLQMATQRSKVKQRADRMRLVTRKKRISSIGRSGMGRC